MFIIPPLLGFIAEQIISSIAVSPSEPKRQMYTREVRNDTSVWVCTKCGCCSFDKWGDLPLSNHWTSKCRENASPVPIRYLEFNAKYLSDDFIAMNWGTNKEHTKIERPFLHAMERNINPYSRLPRW